MMIDLSRARHETPGCKEVLHFNNAGAALVPEPVLEAVVSYLQLESRIGGYEATARAQDDIERVYDAAAELIGCHRDEIAMAETGTMAWDMAFYSIPLGPGDRILTAMAEYASNYIAFLQVARKTGARVEIVPNDEYGRLSVEALREMMDERVKLVAMTHVPTNGGLVNPAAEVGKVARDASCLYLLDAVQSVGQIPLDVREIGCDMLATTGRKYLRGPRGTGFLYVRREVLESLEPPFLNLHAATWTSADSFKIRRDARRFEQWETNYASKVGLGVAIDYALGWGVESIRDRVEVLAEGLRRGLAELPGVTVRDLGKEKCGLVTFTVEGKDPAEVKQTLAERNINVSVSRSDSTLLDMDDRRLSGLVRASVHYYNNEEEIERFCTELASAWDV